MLNLWVWYKSKIFLVICIKYCHIDEIQQGGMSNIDKF